MIARIIVFILVLSKAIAPVGYAMNARGIEHPVAGVEFGPVCFAKVLANTKRWDRMGYVGAACDEILFIRLKHHRWSFRKLSLGI